MVKTLGNTSRTKTHKMDHDIPNVLYHYILNRPCINIYICIIIYNYIIYSHPGLDGKWNSQKSSWIYGKMFEHVTFYHVLATSGWWCVYIYIDICSYQVFSGRGHNPETQTLATQLLAGFRPTKSTATRRDDATLGNKKHKFSFGKLLC